ncbi:MAG: DNA-binding protein WhiA [Candidatus Eremiobacteraeota bacterium]|nr:DNA-binding protein WhiA [Candidatus Eremiobacteraeota bacterium]MBV8366901.1 DNA-binding protein WhiA [Candidatus Eremiobacteraeota bacterium]
MFSADAKDEIAAAAFRKPCCPGTFVRTLRAFSSGSARLVLTDRGPVVRAVLRAAKSAGIRTGGAHPAGRRFGRGAIEVRAAQPVRARDDAAPKRSCCRRAWLRAAFLACGSVSDPHRSYHLEFVPPDERAARALQRGLRAFGVSAGRSRRRGKPLVYVKGAPAVAELLAHMGASRAVLALDDLLAVRYTKNVTRRRVNSEAANAARAAATSARQQSAAATLVRRARTHAVSAALREAARLRIAHPDYTIAELAARARPPVSKAAMAYRLRTIERQA